MGRIADLIEEVENELVETKEDLKNTGVALEEAEMQLESLRQEFRAQENFISWVEEFYPDASNQYGAICKVRGE